MSTSILIAALDLAATGLPVFPCATSTKRPTTPHGFKDASTESDVIVKLWRDCPGGLIGVPAGNVSDFDALDLDAKHQDAKDWWRKNRDHLPRTRTHKTRSGGLHLLFQHDNTMRCSAGKIALGVDTRSTGGYVIWWPASGLPILSDAPLAPWPDWLLAEFRPKPRPSSATSNTVNFGGDAWLKGLVRTIVNAGIGERNSVLFWASCRAGEAVRKGAIGEAWVVDVLIEAAKHTGLTEREAQRAIKSGIQR